MKIMAYTSLFLGLSFSNDRLVTFMYFDPLDLLLLYKILLSNITVYISLSADKKKLLYFRIFETLFVLINLPCMLTDYDYILLKIYYLCR